MRIFALVGVPLGRTLPGHGPSLSRTGRSITDA